MPTLYIMGARIGANRMIAAPVSIHMPTISRKMFTMRSSRYLLSEMLSMNAAIASGTFSFPITQAKTDENEIMRNILAICLAMPPRAERKSLR